MTKKIKEQILSVRDTALTNMVIKKENIVVMRVTYKIGLKNKRAGR